jgi:hypothetical protein
LGESLCRNKAKNIFKKFKAKEEEEKAIKFQTREAALSKLVSFSDLASNPGPFHSN